MNRGVTLPELLVVLLLVGMGAPMVLGQARAHGDALAVRAVREEVVALFHRARMEARLRGEARVLILEGEGVFLLASDDPEGGPAARVRPEARGVTLRIRGDRTRAEIRFGPLGLASFAAATLELERGSRQTELVVSGHGRVRR